MPPYPTGGPAYRPKASGTGVSYVEEGTAAPIGVVAPTGGYGTAAPTDAYDTPSEFTGAAAHVKMAGALVGAGAIAAFFL